MDFSSVRLEAEVYHSAAAFPAAMRRTARSLPTLTSRLPVDRRLRPAAVSDPFSVHTRIPRFPVGGIEPEGHALRPLHRSDHLHPEGLGSAGVMLSHGVIAYFALICQSRLHPPTSRFTVIRGALPCGTVLAGTETFPLSPPFCSTMPSCPPRRARRVHMPSSSPPATAFTREMKVRRSLPHRPLWVFPADAGPGGLTFRGSIRFASATAWWIARLLDGPTWDCSRPPRLLLLSLRPTSHLLRTSGMATTPTGQSAPAGLSPARTTAYWAARLPGKSALGNRTHPGRAVEARHRREQPLNPPIPMAEAEADRAPELANVLV